MPEQTTPRIAVVGAAGFVGRELLRQLAADGIRATAIARGIPDLVVDGDVHDVMSPTDARGRDYDIVINLAYPTAGAPYNYPDQNAAIIGTVDNLLRDGGRLIHASTLAVFGLALDRPVMVGAVKAVRDEAYVEAKIEAEHVLAGKTTERNLASDIVRFGNIWGKGSGAWALPVVHKLVTGRPVGVEGLNGYSNTTDVANAASYLIHLALQPEAPRAGEVRYHHLAEFSAVRWSEWVTPLAEALGVEAVIAPASAIDRPSTVRGELTEALEPFNLRRLGRSLSKDRLVGSWERSILRKFPADTRDNIKGRTVHARAPRMARPDQTFLEIVAGGQEFRSVVDDRWTQRLTKDQSLEAVLRWLAE